MWAFERRFLAPEDIEQGLLPEKWHVPLTVLLAGLYMLLALWQPLLQQAPLPQILSLAAQWALPTLLLARLTTLDLTAYVLPDLYTLPLLVLGLILAPAFGLLPISHALLGAAVGFAISLLFAFLMQLISRQAFLGGGDIKMIAAAGAWLGASMLAPFLMVACLLSMVIALIPQKNRHIAFGPGLCLSFWLFLHQKSALLTLIHKGFSLITG